MLEFKLQEEMGRAYGTYSGLVGNVKKRDHWGGLVIDGAIILKLMLMT